MKTLYLHIGHEKTGTTSLQRTLSGNRATLGESGVLYPMAGAAGVGGHFGLINPLFRRQEGRDLEFLPDAHRYDFGVWKDLAAEIKEDSSPTIVISAEHFASRLDRESIAFVAATLDSIPQLRTKVILYARRQDEYVESKFSTLVKGGSRRTIEKILEMAMSRNREFDYSRIISDWCSSFSENDIEMRAYDRSLRGADIVEDFLSCISRADLLPQIARPPRENPSLAPATALLCSRLYAALNWRLAAKTTSRAKIRRMIGIVDQLVKSNQHAELPLLSDLQKRALVDEYADVNREMLRRFGSASDFDADIPPSRESPSAQDLDLAAYLHQVVNSLMDELLLCEG